MKSYNIEISKESLDSMLDPANLVIFQGGFMIKEDAKLIKYIEEPIVIIGKGFEDHLDLHGELVVQMGRYYPNSKNYQNYQDGEKLSYIILEM